MSEATQEQVTQRIREDVIPKLVRQGKFGDKSSTIRDTRVKFMAEGSGHWASSSGFVEVDLTTPDGTQWTKYLVAKLPPFSEYFRQKMKSDIMYENECAIYNHVLPYYKSFLEDQAKALGNERIIELGENLAPECYLAQFNPDQPKESIVILDDMRQTGFKCAEARTTLDWSHVEQSLKLIARYHGICYALQEAKPADFDRLVSLAKPTRYFEEDRPRLEVTMVGSSRRPVVRLLRNGCTDVDKEDLKRLYDVFGDMYDIMPQLTLSGSRKVLCHGDFCSNNILYQYNQTTTPAASLLIDFQTPYFSSPAIDISFFLYTNTDKQFRELNFDKALHTYYSSLNATISTILGRTLTEDKFSEEAFLQDFANHALYGYSICAFFSPIMVMIKTEPFDLEEDMKKSETLPKDERMKEIMGRGGEQAEVILEQVFRDFYTRGYFKHILKNHPAKA